MVRGLYTAYTGMKAQQEKMDTISNNLANVNTNGFKQDDVVFRSFKEVMATKINDPEVVGSEKIGTMSLGVQVDQIYTNFQQGALKQTESPYNIALEGPGMIQVARENEDGSRTSFYTRDGAMTLNQESQLVTMDGYYIQGKEGPITIPDGYMTITQDGTIFVGQEEIDQIQVTDFEEATFLKKVGDSLYTPREGAQEKAFTGTINQGFLESSNVNSVKEMIEMISVMRGYETNQKVLTTMDATLEKSVNQIGRL